MLLFADSRLAWTAGCRPTCRLTDLLPRIFPSGHSCNGYLGLPLGLVTISYAAHSYLVAACHMADLILNHHALWGLDPTYTDTNPCPLNFMTSTNPVTDLTLDEPVNPICRTQLPRNELSFESVVYYPI